MMDESYLVSLNQVGRRDFSDNESCVVGIQDRNFELNLYIFTYFVLRKAFVVVVAILNSESAGNDDSRSSHGFVFPGSNTIMSITTIIRVCHNQSATGVFFFHNHHCSATDGNEKSRKVENKKAVQQVKT
jgi:hypothetical protein